MIRLPISSFFNFFSCMNESKKLDETSPEIERFYT
uniref:Uncharacterized protein n=1 Tax=Lepeophtheirus salmonis TaxID=72036 RepID=A0A0K2TKG0_LEPSM